MDGEKMDWEIQRGEYIEQLQTENQRLREALEFYADVDNYDENCAPGNLVGDYINPDIFEFDQGEIARNALQKEGS